MIDAQKLNGGSSHNNIILEVDRSSLEAGTNTIITKKKNFKKSELNLQSLKVSLPFPSFGEAVIPNIRGSLTTSAL